MTRAGTRRKVDAAFAAGRIRSARDFMKAAQDGLDLAQEGRNAAPIVSSIVNAAIAFCDAVTARRGNVANAQDHGGAPALLREILGNDLPREQEARFRRILGEKDASQYGAKALSLALARKRMQDLTRFAAWAEDQVAG